MDKPYIIVIEIRKTFKVRTVKVGSNLVRVVVVENKAVRKKVFLPD